MHTPTLVNTHVHTSARARAGTTWLGLDACALRLRRQALVALGLKAPQRDPDAEPEPEEKRIHAYTPTNYTPVPGSRMSVRTPGPGESRVASALGARAVSKAEVMPEGSRPASGGWS